MKLTDSCKMPFGKHRGQNMEDVPSCHLLWLDGQFKKLRKLRYDQKAVLEYIDDNHDVLAKEETERAARPKPSKGNMRSIRPILLNAVAMLIGICSLTAQPLQMNGFEGYRGYQIELIKSQIEILGISKEELFTETEPNLLSGVGEYQVMQLGPKQKGFQFVELKPLDIDTLNSFFERDQYIFLDCDDKCRFGAYKYRPASIKEFLPLSAGLKKGDKLKIYARIED